MLPSSRYIGGIARPRDLQVVTKSRAGSLDKFRLDQSLPSDNDASPMSARVPGPSHKSIAAQASQRSSNDPAPPSGAEALIENVRPRSTSVTPIDASLIAQLAPQPSFASRQTRGFHTSLRIPYDSTSYNVTDVPEFFVKYKEHRATPSRDPEAHERRPDDLGLMPRLADSIRSGDVVATTRRLKAKIPVEHHAAEGHVVHPSGFVVPGPGHTSTSDVARAKERERNEKLDQATQTAAVARRVLESDFEKVDATTLPSLHKVPFEVHEPDGTVKHPSGFVPPTPAHKFRHTVDTIDLRDRKVSAVRQRPRQPSPPRRVLRAIHTSSAPQASEDS